MTFMRLLTTIRSAVVTVVPVVRNFHSAVRRMKRRATIAHARTGRCEGERRARNFVGRNEESGPVR
jgi:hypothetical protein